ncbi:MAG: acetylglutamate kinase [Oscillospiraceae bacterium]|nr:acetylglutamate kinase [Oscillospiraceae bacterium]
MTEYNVDNQMRTRVLNEALPYIQQYSGKIVVVKYGGAAMIDDELKQAVMSDIVLLSVCGVKIVLVHGGGPEINSVLNKMGIEPKFSPTYGMRCTDNDTMDVVQMVLCGKVNKDLVRLIFDHGGRAIGLSGLDSGLLQATQLAEELGYVGEVNKIKPRPIYTALESGYIPVIATVATGASGESYNINADIAAAQIAAKIKAANLILMTDIKGVLRDKNDESTLIHTIRASEVALLKEQGVIGGGMIPKVDCCLNAVRDGVGKANIIDGRIPHSILLELLTDKGTGTMMLSDFQKKDDEYKVVKTEYKIER